MTKPFSRRLAVCTRSKYRLLFSGTYYVLASTDVTQPLTNWTTVTTGLFDGLGNFSVTNVFYPTVPQRFYLLQVPQASQ